MLLWFLFQIFISFAFILSGQDNYASFDRITIMDGLSQSSVYCILQDNKGFLWFGTRDGLNKYDGYTFKSFKNSSDNPNSISNNEVISLCQDNSGLLWIGTRGGGLNIYDPRTEKFWIFRKKESDPHSINSNVVSAIFKDSKGNMWVGTMEGLYKAIAMSIKDSISVSLTNISKNANLTTGPILAIRNISESKKGNLLICTENQFYLFNPSTRQNKLISLPGIQYFTSAFQQSDSVLWMGTFEYGLFKVVFNKDEEGTIKSYSRYDVTQKGDYHLNQSRVDAMLNDQFNNLWVATRGGLVKFDLKKYSKTTFTNNRIDDKSISDNRLNSLFEDCTGVLWIGTESQGLNKFDLYKKQFHHFKSVPGNTNSLSNNFVTAIHGSQSDNVWIGTDGGGLDKIDFSNWRTPVFNHYKSAPNNSGSLLSDNIISLLQDYEGTLWIGSTINSIGKLNKGQAFFQYFPLSGYIYAFMENRDGYIWTGNWNYGLFCYNKKTNTYKNFQHNESNPNSLSFNVVLSIFQDKNRNIWVGTKGGGLNKLIDPGINPLDAKFRIYKNEPDNPASLSHNDVYCIYQDKSGVLWIGTAGGLNKVIYVIKNNEPEITFKSYLESDGLPNGVIYGILEDKHGNLWMSTNNGISKFNPRTEKFINFDIDDGLQANEFHYNSYFEDSKGRMYFGGINGLNAFYPDSIIVNPFKPKIVFTGIKILGVPVEIGKKINNRIVLQKSLNEKNEIELTFRDKEITIEFAAIHFAVPKKNKYLFRLNGFNDQWQQVSSRTRSVTYTNLDRGDYVFEVKASNNDGIWNDSPAILKIKVFPPPWKTIWAYMLYASAIAVLLLIFRRYTLIAVTEKNKLKIEHLEREKIEELSRLKIQFFTNVSHELRTPLTLINGPLEELIVYKKTDDFIKQQLGLMHRNVNRLLQMINQLLDFRKIDSGQLKLKVSEVNLIELINDIYISFNQYSSVRNISFHYMHHEENMNLWLDKEKITTVFYNILSNAFKFSPDKGSIIIDITIKEKQDVLPFSKKKNLNSDKSVNKRFAEIKIIDSGIGIDEENIEKIFDRFYQVNELDTAKFGGSGIGLAIAREYIKMHGGSIDVESASGKGSCFRVLLPFGKAHLNPEYVTILNQPEEKETLFFIKDSIEEALFTEESTQVEATSKINETDLKKPVILIIEDNVEMLEYLHGKFSSKYKILRATNGAKGIETAIENNPDLIITDLMMPGIDGMELCRRIKTDINTSHIPIIILTAKSTEESMIEGLETGADVYITKPFNVDVLKAQIKTLLDSRQKMKFNFSRQLILQPKEVTFTSTDEKFLKKLMEVVELNIADVNFGIKELTQAMGMSHSVIFRKIKSLAGLNVVELIRSIRLKKAALILKKNKLPIAEVSYMVGFSDPKYFSKCFIKEFGFTPTEYSNKAEKEPPAIET